MYRALAIYSNYPRDQQGPSRPQHVILVNQKLGMWLMGQGRPKEAVLRYAVAVEGQ